MTEQKKVEGQAPAAGEAKPAGEAKSLDRRTILGFLGVGALLSQACGKGAFSSGTKSGKKIDNNGGTSGQDGDDGKAPNSGGKKPSSVGPNSGDSDSDGGDGPDGGPDADGGGDVNPDSGQDASGKGGADGGVDSDTDTNDCHANDTGGVIDADKLPELPDAMKPTVKFYGRDVSCMVAMKFPDAAKDIKQVILAKADGKLQALHGISGADKKGDKFRPIVVDNINLAGSDKLLLVIQQDEKRWKTLIPKEYFNKLGGKDIVDLAPMTVPADWAANQSVTQFAEKTGSFNSDPNISYPGLNAGEIRNLQTVKSSSEWTKADGVKGLVTDVMGDTIANISGGAIIEYNMFCTYFEVGGKFYRTMLQIG